MFIKTSFDYSVSRAVERIQAIIPDAEVSFIHYRTGSEWKAIVWEPEEISSQKHSTPEAAIEELEQLVLAYVNVREAA